MIHLTDTSNKCRTIHRTHTIQPGSFFHGLAPDRRQVEVLIRHLANRVELTRSNPIAQDTHHLGRAGKVAKLKDLCLYSQAERTRLKFAHYQLFSGPVYINQQPVPGIQKQYFVQKILTGVFDTYLCDAHCTDLLGLRYILTIGSHQSSQIYRRVQRACTIATRRNYSRCIFSVSASGCCQ